MTTSYIQPAFTAGEVAPSLFGREDLARSKVAASTARNFYVSFRGGLYSRPGTAFVGFSKQTGRSFPPRLIDFEFSINQGLSLEFGNNYMRVIKSGAFVTEAPVGISAISKSNPAAITLASAAGATSANPNTGATATSYVQGEVITLAGGTFTTAAQLRVVTTRLIALQPNVRGANYRPGDTVTLAGGTQVTPPVITVLTTLLDALPVVTNAGSGGTPGPAVLTGTTGTGTKFQVNCTIDGTGIIASIDSIVTGGSYTVGPTTTNAEPVTGGALAGATLSISMGILTFAVTTAGSLSANPAGATFTQASTSGTGSGATFQSALFGPNTLTVSNAGVYTVFPPNPVAQAATSGSGSGATYNIGTGSVSPFSNGDWVFIQSSTGMPQVNGQTFVLGNVAVGTAQLFDVYGNAIDSTLFGTYTGGGTAARIYTLVTPYAEADLKYLKYTQSADVMSLCCINQVTQTEYPPLDLDRLSDSNWTLNQVIPAATIQPPTGLTGFASASGTVNYQYVVTSVNPVDGTESVASAIVTIPTAVNMTTTPGGVEITWTPVPGVNQYNVYKATPGVGLTPPIGSLYGFAGTVVGNGFLDSNVVPDFTQVPPSHSNPFARGRITGVTVLTQGTGFGTPVFTINSATGSGAIIAGIVGSNAGLSDAIVVSGGQNYLPTDTVTITGGATVATAKLIVGPQIGTYPSVPAYFQQRRVYADTINQPDTYFMSRPGSFTNFDFRTPTISTDAITGNPWSVEVNGIQYMVSMPGGLVVLTGLEAWQLTGTGGSSLNPQPIAPNTQQAQPQAYNGCSPTVPPLRIDYDILYVQAKGSNARDLSYNFYSNIYTGTDLTLNSSHLFTGYTIREWAWCEEPYKLVYAVRNDGVMLSLCYVKPQEVAGWTRFDTNGLFQSCCSVTEPQLNVPTTPLVDALYVAVQRTIGTHAAYTIERMDNRLWPTVQDAWCVDCGIVNAKTMPAATLTASSPTGLGAISGFTGLLGGKNYGVATFGYVVDNNGQGPGTGATVALTIVGGSITGMTFPNSGAGYINPQLVIEDPSYEGSGAFAILTLNNAATFTANPGIFTLANVGDVIRMGGGVATITAFTNATTVTANITSPIIAVQPNSTMVEPQPSGFWSVVTPSSIVTGLQYLAGATVTGLYDGFVLPPVVVPASGTITLPQPATAVTLGFGFTAQMQTVYLDPPGATQQGSRKKNAAVTIRVESSRGMLVGANQPDGSTLSPPQIAPTWSGLTAVPEKGAPAYGSSLIPMFTGDIRVPIAGGFATPGQIAIQQSQPLPCAVLAVIVEELAGDVAQTEMPRQQSRANVGAS